MGTVNNKEVVYSRLLAKKLKFILLELMGIRHREQEDFLKVGSTPDQAQQLVPHSLQVKVPQSGKVIDFNAYQQKKKLSKYQYYMS